MRREVQWESFEHGEDSTVDPHTLKEGQAARLINIDPTGKPRDGIKAVGNILEGGASWVYPFTDTANGAILARSGRDLWLILPGQSNSLLAAGIFANATGECSAERIMDTVVIVGDAGESILVQKDAGRYTVSPAWIERPASETLDVTFTPPGTGDVAVWTTYAHTYVRHVDSPYFTGTATTGDGYLDPRLESAGDLTLHETVLRVKDTAVTLTVNMGAIPAGATHVRFYATVGTLSTIPEAEVIAKGMSLLWLADIPIESTVVTYTTTITDGTLAGETHINDRFGIQPPPPGRFVKYHNGRLWIGGDRTNPGRWYHSNLIAGESPLKYLLTFGLDQFSDTSVDDTELSMGVAASRGDLIFFSDKDVWRLPNGDPQYAPVRIASGMGTLFAGTVVEVGQVAYYLSQRGPAVVSGSEVELIKSFTVDHVWPSNYSETGYFHRINGAARKALVRGVWYDSDYHVTDGKVWAVMGHTGPWSIDPMVEVHLFAKLGEKELYGMNRDTGVLYKVFDGNTVADAGTYFTVTARYRPQYCDRKHSRGSPYYAIVYARWQDVGELRTDVVMDGTRVEASYRYVELTPDIVPYGLVLPDTNNELHRTAVQQCFRAGAVGTWIQPTVKKVIYSRFELRGVDIMLHISDARGMEYISIEDSDGYTDDETVALDSDLAVFGFDLTGG